MKTASQAGTALRASALDSTLPGLRVARHLRPARRTFAFQMDRWSPVWPIIAVRPTSVS